jgi:hypothetical protein
MKKGQKVDVYQDPITRQRIEESGAQVLKVLKPCGYTDCNGNALIRCLVVFPGESRAFPRDVAEI